MVRQKGKIIKRVAIIVEGEEAMEIFYNEHGKNKELQIYVYRKLNRMCATVTRKCYVHATIEREREREYILQTKEKEIGMLTKP